MLKSIYTNTSKPTAIAGLLVLTVGLAYCQSHSTEIVEGTAKVVKEFAQGFKRGVENRVHSGKQQYYVCGMDIDGNMYDTGRRIWK